MKTLIIGSGISATTYAATFPRAEDEQVIMTSGPHLWEQLDANHIMGQPKALLVGQTLGTNRDRRLPKGPLDPKSYMRAGEFAAALAKKKETVVDDYLLHWSWVQRVSKAPTGGYLVKVSNLCPKGVISRSSEMEIHFDRVVFAPGPGPNRPLTLSTDKDPDKVDVKAMRGHVVAGDDFMSAAWKPPDTLMPAREVAVMGGSATAAWVVELAKLRGYKVILWYTRPDNNTNDPAKKWDVTSRFAAAFPDGWRNQAVQRDFANERKVLDLKGVYLRGRNGKHHLALWFNNQSGGVELYPADLLIYSLGYEHTATEGVRAILDANIQEEMVAFYDRDRAISDDQCLLAVGVPDGSLLVVGSGMVSKFGFQVKDVTKLGSKVATYADIKKTLPPASQPTEGIAMLMAGIEAFNRYMPVEVTPKGLSWNINFNLCNRTQLAAFVAQQFTDLPPFAANLAVALIIKLRAHKGNTHGLTDEVVSRILDGVKRYWEALQKLNPKLPEKDLRKGAETVNGVQTGTEYYRVNLHEEIADYLIEKGGAALTAGLQSDTIAQAVKGPPKPPDSSSSPLRAAGEQKAAAGPPKGLAVKGPPMPARSGSSKQQ
jgi:hypothetical protein